MTYDQWKADDSLWFQPDLDIEDAERCQGCRCYFVEEELLQATDGHWLCLDCLDNELTSNGTLLLEDQR